MAGAAVFFLGSISLVPLLPTGFVPAADRGQTQITIELPPGSTLAETRASGDAFAPGAAAEARRAVLTLTTSHRNDRSASMADIETQLRNKMLDIPGARFTVGPPDSGVKMQLVLKSDDPVALLASAQKVERELRTLQGVGNISSSASLVRPEIIVRPDSARAADLGVTAAAIGETVRVATAGGYDTSLPKLNLSERQVPIRVKLPDTVRADLATLERLTVPGKNGPVMLGTVATLSMESGPAQIDRLNRSRNVTLDVELGRRQLGDLNEEARALPSLRNLPPGVSIAELGDAQEMQALFAARRPPGPRRAAHRGTLGALRCAGGRLSQTQPPDRDDLHRHGRRHAAIGPGLGRRPELSFAHGHRRDRWPDHLDATEPAGGAGGVHVHR